MAKRKSRAVRSAAGNRGKPFVVGPMNFGRSQIGWGASSSPAARAAGAVYGQLPRSFASGTMPYGRMGGGTKGNPGITGAYRRILNPWGNNVPKLTARNTNGIGQTGWAPRVRPVGGWKAGAQDPTEISIDYPANDPRMWPIAGGKRIIMFQAAKANFVNKIVDRAFFRGGYDLQQSYPTFTGSDETYAKEDAWYQPFEGTSPSTPMTG